MTWTQEIRFSSHRPPPGAGVAAALRFAGVYDPALLEHAERWASDWTLAWRECDRIELLLPIALVRRASIDVVAGVARRWWLDAWDTLGDLGWPVEDRELAYACVAGAVAPDVDVALLGTVHHQAIERAGRRAPGRHRYRLLTAASCVASLGIQRVRAPLSAAAAAALLGEHLRGALVDAAEASAGDLFADRIDVEAFLTRALELGRERLDPSEVQR